MMTMSFTTRSASRIEESGSGISSSPQESYRITDVKTPKKISTSSFSNINSDDELLDDCINVLTSWILDKSSPRPYFKSLCVSAKHALESKRARRIASKTSVQDLWTTSGVSHVLLPALIKAVEWFHTYNIYFVDSIVYVEDFFLYKRSRGTQQCAIVLYAYHPQNVFFCEMKKWKKMKKMKTDFFFFQGLCSSEWC